MSVFSLNTLTFLIIAFGMGSLAVLIALSTKQSLGSHIRQCTSIFSAIIFIFAVAYALIYYIGSSQYALGMDSVCLGSVWLNVISVGLGWLLIYTSNKNSSERHAEATLFAIIAYSQCVTAMLYITYFVWFFGTNLMPACYASDICVNILTDLYTLLAWVYICMVARLSGKPIALLSKVFCALAITDSLLFLTSPFTGLVVTMGNGAGTELGPLYLVTFLPATIIAVSLIIASLKSDINLAEKGAILILSLSIPVVLVLELAIEDFYAAPFACLIGITFCSLGIAQRRAQAFQSHMVQVGIASTIQQGMLPQEFPNNDRLEIAARMWPALDVAGDFYDFCQPDEDRVFVSIADVSGRDISAAMLMAQVRALVHEFELRGNSPDAILDKINRFLAEEKKDSYASLWVGEIDLHTGMLTYASADHPRPILLKDGGGQVTFLQDTGDPALGETAGTSFSCLTASLHASDAVLLYTNGLPRFADKHGKLYEESRFFEYLQSNAGLGGKEIIEGLYNDAVAFSSVERQSNDVTMLYVSCRPSCAEESGELPC